MILFSRDNLGMENLVVAWLFPMVQVIQPPTSASMLLALPIIPTTPQQPIYMKIEPDSMIRRVLEQIQRATHVAFWWTFPPDP